MKKNIFALTVLGALVSCVHSETQKNLNSSVASSELNTPYYETEFLGGWENKSRQLAGSNHISGYKIGNELCGEGNLKFPRVSISTRPGYCVGIVAGKDSGLIAPRTIVQIPGSEDFLMADFGGWVRNNGRIILIKRQGSGYKLYTLLSKLDYPHGLAFGPDGKAYVGVQDRIFRFNPLSKKPAQSMEVVIRDLPGASFVMPDGTPINKNLHPLKQFVFDRNGAIYVNIGAPTDACGAHLKSDGTCFSAESNRPTAAIWKFSPQSGKVFKALSTQDKNPVMEVMATGLRNSMALLVHPQYPKPGTAFLQGENARDFPDPAQPNEELNVILKGKHYGWPYCYNNESVSPDFKSFISKNAKYKNHCAGQSQVSYQKPWSLFPPHSSPLDLKYYSGNRFPELQNKVLVSWHGYMPTGSRIAFAAVDGNGFPVQNTKALSYGLNCGSRKLIVSDKESAVPGVQFEDLIAGWYGVGGVRPQGAPVGMTIASDGSIWLVEDKNATILRIDRDSSGILRQPEACDNRTEDDVAELLSLAKGSSKNEALLTNIRKNLVERHCMGCHSNFNISPEMNEAQKDSAVAQYMFKQDSWFLPGNLKESRIHQRTHALGVDRPMPGNAAELLANDASYRQAVTDLNTLINTIIPGETYVVDLASAPSLKVRNQNKEVCGAIPNKDEVLVIESRPRNMSGFMQIYRPAKKYLNGDCAPGSKYFMGADYLKPVGARSPASAEGEGSLYVSRPHSQRDQFSFGIEGPAIDASGNLYAVNFEKKGTIGVVFPNGQAENFLELPKGSVGNSIAISPTGMMYIADYVGHKILQIDPTSRKTEVYVENVGMSQPNDLVLAKNEVLYVTDPDWKTRTSRVWKIEKGQAKVIYSGKEIFNGIDLSPDENFLYLGDSRGNKIMRFKIQDSLSDPQMIQKFQGHEIDGLKVDAQENIYVARITKGTIAKISRDGQLLQEIQLNGENPTNLVFGGRDGKTVYVTQRSGGFIESFRVEAPGRAWK